MKCKDINKLLSAYLDEEVNPAERKLIEDHLLTCDKCRGELRLIASTREELRQALSTKADGVEPPIQAWNSTRQRIESKSSFWEQFSGILKKPVWLTATSVVLVLIVFGALWGTGVLPDSALSPEKVLAKAQTAILTVQSYRASGYYNPSVIRTQWEFTGDRYHSVNSVTYGDGSEMIFIGEQIYLKGYNSTTASIEDMQAETPSAKMTQEHLNMLTAIEVLPEENIDGIVCFHYRGQVDNEQYFERYLQPILEKAYYDSFIKMNETRERKFTEEEIIENVKKIIASAKEKDKNKEYNVKTWEFWIGKDDYIIRQWEHFLNGWSSWIVKYFDFNVPISIEAPLDAEGNLLPGWTSMTERSFPELSQ
jgi:hypothetical protein